MPKVSRDSASQGGDHGPVVDRSEDLDDYTVNFVTFREDIDHTPLLRGLPDDRCHCPHWGYAIKGGMTLRFGDRQEVFEAGDAFYAPPATSQCTPSLAPNLQFRPADELRKTSEVIMQNMRATRAQEPAAGATIHQFPVRRHERPVRRAA